MEFIASFLASFLHLGKFLSLLYGAKEMEPFPRDSHNDYILAGGSEQLGKFSMSRLDLL